MNTIINVIKKISSIPQFIKTHRKTSISVFLAIGVVLFFVFHGGDNNTQVVVKAEFGSVVQEVSITGRVRAVRAVDLAFERGGRVSYVGVKSGDIINSGKLLVQLDVSELLAQEQREKANVASAEYRLNQLIAVESNKGDNSSAVDAVSKALKIAVDAMVDFTSVQYSYFNTNTSEANQISDTKENVLKLIYGESGLGRVESSYFLSLNGGLKAKVHEAEQGSSSLNNDLLIAEVKNMLIQTKASLELMRSRLVGFNDLVESDLGLIAADIDLINSQIAAMTTQSKSLVNENYDIDIAKSQLEQAKASLALVQAQISKYRLVAPFSGIATNVDIKQGQIISSNVPVISLISNDKFQIEANISEADIAKVSVGDKAEVHLDAYGKDDVFMAKLVAIDLGGKITDAVAVYKVTFEFDSSDPRILSGLTADIDVLTDKRDRALFIPSREIITDEDGTKYVRVRVSNDIKDVRFANLSVITQEDNYKIIEVPIKAGLKGSDGRTEILSGLEEGDEIVTD